MKLKKMDCVLCFGIFFHFYDNLQEGIIVNSYKL